MIELEKMTEEGLDKVGLNALIKRASTIRETS